jgi:hypothetical protein
MTQMKKSMKAVWLSLLLFPGAGQFYLRRPLRALAFAAPLLIAVSVLLDTANRIAAKILSGAVSLDPAVLSAQIEQNGGNDFWPNVAGAVVLLCWIGSAVDAWWLVRRAPD